jgi:small GTP-binding protein
MTDMEQAKVTILGDANTGKSSIILRYVSNTFSDHSNPTIGATFMTKVIDYQQRSIKLSIWDTAGQERYHALASNYARDSKACLLVYDVTNRDSFHNLAKWYQSIKDFVPEDVVLVVVGNKEDMVEEETVELEEAKEFADSIEAVYIRTSAKLGTGISEVFLEISKKLLGVKVLNLKESIRSSRAVSVNLAQRNQKNKKSCC